jgi:sulfatase modifying factor 1
MPSISSAFVFLTVLNISATGLSEGVAPTTSAKPEVMPDGNLRDPAPRADTLAVLIATTQKNLVPIPAGTFEMGDWGPEVNEGGLPFDGTRDSKPLHKVRLDGFSIGKFPVTYAEFDLFTAALRLPRINQQKLVRTYRKPNNPAGVGWQGAYDYCQWLGTLTHQLFQLPTEAQWEYAARSGGKRFVYPTDNGESEPGRNLPSFEQGEDAGGLVTVESFPPNPAGIYYMSAGVREWTNDRYDSGYYERSPVDNPKGPDQGAARVLRGFFGSDASAMTFKRWSRIPTEQVGTWTMYDEKTGNVIGKIPLTKYTNSVDSAFRCVRNQPQLTK